MIYILLVQKSMQDVYRVYTTINDEHIPPYLFHITIQKSYKKAETQVFFFFPLFQIFLWKTAVMARYLL